jgi:hypothetical protein
MVRRACKFRQTEVTRMIRAARAAGVEVDRVEIDTADGKIIVHLVGSGSDNPKQLNTADVILERLKNDGKS